MNGLKRPRRPRWDAKANPINLAIIRAAKVMPSELTHILAPAKAALEALRVAKATENDWSVLASAMNVAQAIEKQGVVKGFRAEIRAAELALQTIQLRCTASGTWLPSALYAAELAAISAAVRFHEFQVAQLSGGELIAALDYAQAEVRSTGGRVLTVHSGRQA